MFSEKHQSLETEIFFFFLSCLTWQNFPEPLSPLEVLPLRDVSSA